MKKFVRKTIGAFMALSLAVGAISCSDGLADDDPFVKAGAVEKKDTAINSDTESGENKPVSNSGSFDMPENAYDKGNTQYKGPTGISSLKVGDKVKMIFKGKASKTFKGEFFIVDTTAAADYWLELADKYVINEVPVDFEIEHEFEITKAPKGTGTESTYFAVVGKDDATTIHIEYTELKFVKNGEESSGEQGGQGESGQGQSEEGGQGDQESEDLIVKTLNVAVNHYNDADHGIQYTENMADIPLSAAEDDVWTLKIAGSADEEFTAEMQFVDSEWAGITYNAVERTFTTEPFDFTISFHFSKACSDGKFMLANPNMSPAVARTLNLTKFEFTKESAEEADHGMLSASVDLTWDAGATVEASKLTDATDTSKFVVTYTSNEDTDYHTFKMRVVSPEQELFEGKEEGISINRTSASNDDLHGCSFVNAPATTANTFSYQPSAAEWAKLKAGGFNIYGHGAKITKIVLAESTPAPGGDSGSQIEGGDEPETPSASEPETPSASESETPSASEPETPSASEPETPSASESETPSASEPAASEPTYTEVWTGEQAIDWDKKGIVIDHASFPADFNAVRITYNASAGALKMAVCDPWTDINATSVSAGSIAADGAINLPTGDAQSVTIDLSADSVAGIIGQGQEGAWGGLKIYGAVTITVTKVEVFKK